MGFVKLKSDKQQGNSIWSRFDSEGFWQRRTAKKKWDKLMDICIGICSADTSSGISVVGLNLKFIVCVLSLVFNPHIKIWFRIPLPDDRCAMKKIILAVVLVLILSTPGMCRNYRVEKVIEADLIEIDYKGKRERVQMLHVNIPESGELGRKAWQFTRRRLQNKRVDLEFQTGLRRAGFNRLLAYVIFNGQNFSLDLVRRGWSRYDKTHGTSLKYHSNFVVAERFAQASKMGVWAEEDR